MKTQFFRFTFFLFICLTLPAIATAQFVSIPEPVPPPSAVREAFELNPFYQQWIDVEGFPVVASALVNPYAVKEAAWQIWQVIGHRPEVLQVLAQKQIRFTVIGYTEILADIPEYSDHIDFLTYRQRGAGGGGVVGHRAVTTSEENLLHYPGDTGRGLYNVLIHELAHAIHRFGLNTIDSTFDPRLKIAYDAAMANGLWQGTYAASDRKEYWAEATQAWFNPTGAGSFDNYGTTRNALKAYDPELAALLAEIYGDTEWRYTPPMVRLHLPHLQGFNPENSPTFRHRPELEELNRQFHDPNSDGGDNWVDLRPYDPSLIPILNESRVVGNRTMMAFVNLTQAYISIYSVGRNGTEQFWTRARPGRVRWTPTRTDVIWLIKDPNGKNLAVFQSVKKTGRALITPTLNLITPGLSKISGDNQSGISGTVLSNPFVVEARDQTLTVLEGISVTFTVTAGNGTLSTTRITTDRNGRAESTLTLGGNLGTNTVSVSATGIVGAVTFNAVAEAMVDIPDPNLRVVVLTALGKAKNDPITPSEMSTLTRLKKRRANISNLTGLESATNLTTLDLDENNITDISATAGLTNLTALNLGGNNISDISPVVDLTNLTALSLYGNNISDISVLAGLTNLTRLWLDGINISDISPLLANTGLGVGDEVYVRRNPLNRASIKTHIPVLQSRGVRVEFDTRKVERLLKVSGDNQQGTVGVVLTDPFVVEVRAQDGEAFAEVPVVFAVTEGGGTLSTTSTITDVNGRAQSTLTLGSVPGANTVEVSIEGIAEMVTFTALAEIEFNLSMPAGINLIHVPLKVTAVDGVARTIESIADLYNALGDASKVNFLITYDSQAQGWRSYFGSSDTGTAADRTLTDDMGIIAGMIAPTSVRLTGSPLGIDGSSSITLAPGLNLVGLPLRDSRIMRVSNLFALEGIGSNVPVIILTDGGEFKAVGQPDDPGDIPIIGGQSFIMTARQPAPVTISGDGWSNSSAMAAAPPIARTHIEAKDTTPVLALKGSIVDEGVGVNQAGTRVTVKNLSTGKEVVTVTGVDEAGYRFTVVDIETGRAARIGDVLEISGQPPNPFIGVEPLRYTVTVEDVKRSLIQLPELVAYEIPAETELLLNYPNPFNPETWIPYRLAEDAYVTLTIYDLNGHIVRTVEVGHQIAAVYERRSKAIYWDGRNYLGEQVASGVYFYHLSAGDYSATRKMVILK